MNDDNVSVHTIYYSNVGELKLNTFHLIAVATAIFVVAAVVVFIVVSLCLCVYVCL